MNKIRDNMFRLERLTDFYVCLNENWSVLDDVGVEQRGYGIFDENMVMEFASKERKQQRTPYKFKSGEIFPTSILDESEPRAFCINTLNFKDSVFGYVISSFGHKNDVYDFRYRTWVMNINCSLEQIRVKLHLQWALERLDKTAIIDTLTGVYNRRGYERYLYKTFEESKYNRRRFLVIMGDLDCLKGINDRFGHAEGDTAIRVIAKAFQSCFSNNEICARLGGDEFVIFGSGNYTPEMIEDYRNNIHSYLDRFNKTSNKPYKVETSLGVYCDIPYDDDSLAACVELADERMYRNKALRKQQGVFNDVFGLNI